MMRRDMNKAEFANACARYGFKPQGFLGYFQMPAPFQSRRVSALNGGRTRRQQLAYLIAELRKLEATAEAAAT